MWNADSGRIGEILYWADSGGRWGLCFDYDSGAVDEIKTLPSHLRKWDPRLKVWWINSQTQVVRLAEIAGAYRDELILFLPARPEWLLDRATWIDNRGWEKRRKPQRPEPDPFDAGPKRQQRRKPSPARDTLHLTADAPPELIKAAYRVLARIHHPDAGGDPERMKAINAAYEELTK